MDLPRLKASVTLETERRRIERERAALARDADTIRARCVPMIGFMREAWHVLEPRTHFAEGWVNRAICSHLEAITFGRFLALGLPNKVKFNVPPGMTKSLTISVMWNAWEWGPCGMPFLRHLSTSYVDDWVIRDTDKTRKLITSEWYQGLWGEKAFGADAHGDCHRRVVLTRSASDKFENTAGGSRVGVTFNKLTGGRGDRLTIDDPLSVAQSKSDADREYAKFIMRESVPSRLNDPVRSATALIMQRVHEEDPSGVWEKVGVPHVSVILPMRFELDRRCQTPIFVDPREVEGELLHPERFPLATVDVLEKEMTPYAVSGQHQQRPVPRSGGMFKRHWFKPRRDLPPGYRWVRHWDLADTEETYGADPPYTAGVLLGAPAGGGGPYVIGDVYRLRQEAAEVRKAVRMIGEADRIRLGALGGTYEVQVPQDPGSAGKTVARDMITKTLDGFIAYKLIETGSKIDRAEPMSVQAENGNVEIMSGAWTEAFLDEACLFPGTKFKDQVDALSGAYDRLQKPMRRDLSGGHVPAGLNVFGR